MRSNGLRAPFQGQFFCRKDVGESSVAISTRKGASPLPRRMHSPNRLKSGARKCGGSQGQGGNAVSPVDFLRATFGVAGAPPELHLCGRADFRSHQCENSRARCEATGQERGAAPRSNRASPHLCRCRQHRRIPEENASQWGALRFATNISRATRSPPPPPRASLPPTPQVPPHPFGACPLANIAEVVGILTKTLRSSKGAPKQRLGCSCGATASIVQRQKSAELQSPAWQNFPLLAGSCQHSVFSGLFRRVSWHRPPQ